MRAKFMLTLGVIFVAAVLVFAVQNTAVVDIRFLVWELSVSRALILLVSLLAGLLLGWGGCALSRSRRK